MNFSRIKGIFYRYFYILIKGPQQLSDLFYWPLIDIILWGLTSLWVSSENGGENFSLLLMSGLILWQISWRGSVDVSISLLQEFWHRNLVNLFSTPLKISEWMMGTILLCLSKFVVTVTFGAATVFLLYHVNVFQIGWVFIPFAAILLIFGWTLGLLAGSLIIYWGMQIEAIAWMIGYFFAPFSAVFYPVSVLPFWAQKISWALPSTYIFEGMRGILNGQPMAFSDLFISFFLAISYFCLAVLLFRYVFRKSRAKGLARLE